MNSISRILINFPHFFFPYPQCRIGVNGFENPMRDPKTEEFKNQIGQGCKVKMDETGNILIKRFSKATVRYIKSSQKYIYVFPKHKLIKIIIFDAEEFFTKYLLIFLYILPKIFVKNLWEKIIYWETENIFTKYWKKSNNSWLTFCSSIFYSSFV